MVDAFKAAGLEAENARPFNQEEKDKVPSVAYDGTRFFIPSLGEDAGGRIFIANNEQDASTVFTYYESLGKAGKAFFSWVFRNGTTVVHLDIGVSPVVPDLASCGQSWTSRPT